MRGRRCPQRTVDLGTRKLADERVFPSCRKPVFEVAVWKIDGECAGGVGSIDVALCGCFARRLFLLLSSLLEKGSQRGLWQLETFVT